MYEKKVKSLEEQCDNEKDNDKKIDIIREMLNLYKAYTTAMLY